MTSDDPRSEFTAALRRLRDRVPHLSDEALARRVTAGRRVTVNARRLGEWISGQSVPRSFDRVLAVVHAIERSPTHQELKHWQRLWTAAKNHRSPVPPKPKNRVVVGRPPSDAAALRSRPPLADAVHEALNDGAVRQVVLTGAGGVGKSQLATAAFHATRGELAVWVPASTRQSVLACYARAWRAVVESPAERGWDDETQADLFVAWLRSTSTPWLVVLDDVDEPSELAGLWPIGETGRSIVTTRRRDAALLRPTSRVVQVGMFSLDEAVDYLAARMQSPRDDLHDLAVALGCFPLALSQAAAFLIDTGMGLRDYLRLLADQREHVADLLPPSSPADGHRDTVVDTLRIALERAATLAPPGTVRAMLDLISVLSPDGIPEEVLLSDAACRWVSEPGGRVNLLALRALHRLSLVTHNAGTVEVHALVQRAVRDSVEDRGPLVVAAADALEEVWPSCDPEAVFPIAALLLAHEGSWLWSDGMHPLLRRLGEHLRTTSRLTAADDLIRTLLAQARRDRDVLVLRTQLADVEVDLGGATTVLPKLTEIRREAELVLGPTDRAALWIRLTENEARMEAGMIEASLADALDFVSDFRDVLATDDPLMFSARERVAFCQGLSGDFVGARDAYTTLAAALEESLGPLDPMTLNAVTNLGRWIGETGDARGAIDTYRRALLGLEQTLGRLHNDTFVARHNLAYWSAMAGDLDSALADFVTAVADAKVALGAEHPNTLTFMANHAFWQGMADDPDAATRLRKVCEKIETVFGLDHPRTLRTHQQIAELIHLSGDHTTAITALRSLLSQMTDVQGNNHPRTLEAARLLAQWEA